MQKTHDKLEKRVQERTVDLAKANEVLGAEIAYRKRVEEALKVSQAKYQDLYDNAPDMYASVDTMGEIVECNQTLATATGYTKKEIIGHPIFDMYHPDYMEDAKKTFESFVGTGEVHDAELQLKRQDGSRIEVSLNVSAVRDEQGKILHSRSIWRDITKRKQAEKEIQRLKEELEHRVMNRTAQLKAASKELEKGITERTRAEKGLRKTQERLAEGERIAHFGTVERNPQTGEGWWSDEVYRVLGITPKEGTPTFDTFLNYVHPDDREWVKEIIKKAIEHSICGGDYRIIRPNGEVRAIHSEVKAYRDEVGNPNRIIATILDVSERKQLEQQLLQSQKMKALGRLAAGVAHDFNNILTGIMGFAELLSLQLPDDPKIRGDLSQVQGLAERAKALTRQLLIFSRQQPVQERVTNLNTLIENTLTMLQRIIGEDIHLKLVPDPELGNVRADESQLGQVFLNLAVNARDAMPEGGKLTVETANVMLDGEGTQAEAGPYVTVTVTDTGSGMDTETQQKIFDPFFTTKEVGQGTGLGLSTVHGIIKQHGGAITVSSEPDKGTTFEVYFPRVEAPVEELPAEPREEVQPLGGETILVVEDEETIRILIQRVLEIQGYQVFCASNASEAEQNFARQVGQIDLLLTDIVMPGDSGPKLYKRLAVKHPLLKALFISGYTTDQGLLQNDLLKPDMPFLQKPFEPSKLSQKVREVLDTRKKEDQIS